MRVDDVVILVLQFDWWRVLKVNMFLPLKLFFFFFLYSFNFQEFYFFSFFISSYFFFIYYISFIYYLCFHFLLFFKGFVLTCIKIYYILNTVKSYKLNVLKK